MFDIGISEIGVIAVVALIVIGPERLPRVARTVGTLLGRAQRYVNDVKSEVNREIELDELRKLQAQMKEAAKSVQEQVSSVGTEVHAAVQDAEKSFQSGIQAVGSEVSSAAQSIGDSVTGNGEAVVPTLSAPGEPSPSGPAGPPGVATSLASSGGIGAEPSPAGPAASLPYAPLEEPPVESPPSFPSLEQASAAAPPSSSPKPLRDPRAAANASAASAAAMRETPIVSGEPAGTLSEALPGTPVTAAPESKILSDPRAAANVAAAETAPATDPAEQPVQPSLFR